VNVQETKHRAASKARKDVLTSRCQSRQLFWPHSPTLIKLWCTLDQIR